MESPSSTSDRAVSSDPRHWVDQYGDYLFRYAYSRLRDTSAAEEVVQETFLAGIRSRQQYRGAGSERGWLLAILKRKLVDFVRNRARSAPSYDADRDPSEQLFDEQGNWRGLHWGAMPDAQLQSGELWAILQDCLRSIPQSQADVFVLSVMEELSTEEICQELQISPSNVWVRLHRARLALAKCVGARWFDDKDARHAQ